MVLLPYNNLEGSVPLYGIVEEVVSPASPWLNGLRGLLYVPCANDGVQALHVARKRRVFLHSTSYTAVIREQQDVPVRNQRSSTFVCRVPATSVVHPQE